jgi:hypothetical protein
MCQIQAGYFTKNGTVLQVPVCTAKPSDRINVESVVEFSDTEIGGQYKCELKISGPGLPSFSFFTPLRVVKSSETFTSEDFTNPVPTGLYTCTFIAIYDSEGNTICTFIPLIPLIPLIPVPRGISEPCSTVNIIQVVAVGSINFVSKPPGAEIFLNNSDQQHITPFTITNVAVGTHSYRLTLANFPDITGSVTVQENTIAQVSVNFTTTGQVNVGLVVLGLGVTAVLIGGIYYFVLRKPDTIRPGGQLSG